MNVSKIAQLALALTLAAAPAALAQTSTTGTMAPAATTSTMAPAASTMTAPAAKTTTAPATTTTSKAAAKTAAKTAASGVPANEQFTTAAAATASCPTDTVVWASLGKSKAFHLSTSKLYGKTKHGAYVCEKAATAAGLHQAKN
jgi:hypothetical protein